MCSILDQFKNLCEGEGLKFVFKFKLMIPEIGGHVLAGSQFLLPEGVRSFSRSGGGDSGEWNDLKYKPGYKLVNNTS